MSLVGGRECQAVAVAVRGGDAVYSRLPACSYSLSFLPAGRPYSF